MVTHAPHIRPGDLVKDLLGNVAWMCVAVVENLTLGSSVQIVWWSFRGGKTISETYGEHVKFDRA